MYLPPYLRDIHGTAFPPTPIERELFYRDDLHIWYIYNGTSWVSLISGGDMLKSVYDTDDDGVVDNSEKLEGSTKAQVRDHSPKAHKASHQDGGADEISVAGLSGELADIQPPKLTQGLDADKPAASTAGKLYWATDTEILYRDSGATWEELLRGESVIRLAQLSEKSHGSLTSVGASDHHAKTTDDEVRGLLQQGLAANRPAAGTAGRLYYSTDTGVLERDTGAAWEEKARGETAIRLAQLSDRAHSSLSGIGASDHHAKTGDNEVYGLLAAGLASGRPTAGTAGRFYFSTDTLILERDDGAAWVEMARGEAATRLAQLAEKQFLSLTDTPASYSGQAGKAPVVNSAEGALEFAAAPLFSLASKTYYIDAVNGSDNNGGEAAGDAFATWDKAKSMIPAFILAGHSYTIRIIGHLNTVLILENKMVGSVLTITGDTVTAGNHQIQGFDFRQIIGDCHLNYMQATAATRCNIRSCMMSSNVSSGVRYMEFRNATDFMLEVLGSRLYVRESDFGTDVGDYCIASVVSHVASRSNSGNSNQYGLYAHQGGVIAKILAQPTGTVGNELTAYGGVIR